MPAPAYRQGHFYTCSELAAAYVAGARDCRDNGGSVSDELILRASDAYVKSVHPVEEPLRTVHDRAREAIVICGGDPTDAELVEWMAHHVALMRGEHEFDESRRTERTMARAG